MSNEILCVQLQNLPPHIKCVTTLPYEIWTFKIAAELSLIIQSTLNPTVWFKKYLFLISVQYCSGVLLLWTAKHDGLQYLLGDEAEASPSIANTLWRVWTMFARSAITPPEVNGFGWNLGNSESMVWRCPWQILGAIRAEAASGGRAEILFFFVH